MAIQISGSWNLIGSYTASQGFYGTASYANTASYVANALITASVLGNTITFTKGNNSTFDIIVSGGGSGSAFPYTGSAQITGSLNVTGSIFDNGIDVGYVGPAGVMYRTPEFTIFPTASVTNNVHISSSGIHNIDFTNFASTVSCSLNVYYWIESIPLNTEAQLLLTIPSGSGNIVTYRTLVTASNSTTWWSVSSNLGIGSGIVARSAATTNGAQRRYAGANTQIVHQVVNSPYGIILSKSSTNQEVVNMFAYTGSAGTPI